MHRHGCLAVASPPVNPPIHHDIAIAPSVLATHPPLPGAVGVSARGGLPLAGQHALLPKALARGRGGEGEARQQLLCWLQVWLRAGGRSDIWAPSSRPLRASHTLAPLQAVAQRSLQRASGYRQADAIDLAKVRKWVKHNQANQAAAGGQGWLAGRAATARGGCSPALGHAARPPRHDAHWLCRHVPVPAPCHAIANGSGEHIAVRHSVLHPLPWLQAPASS